MSRKQLIIITNKDEFVSCPGCLRVPAIRRGARSGLPGRWRQPPLAHGGQPPGALAPGADARPERLQAAPRVSTAYHPDPTYKPTSTQCPPQLQHIRAE